MNILVNIDVAVVRFVMTEATIGGLNNSAAHSGERREEIASAVLAVQDNTRAMWERVLFWCMVKSPNSNIRQ